MQLIKCGTIETLDDPIFYARIDGKNETSGDIVKAFREYWYEQNQPTEAEKQAANDEVYQDLADEDNYYSQQMYCWELY